MRTAAAQANYKNIRDGKCSGLFTLIEEILSRTVVGRSAGVMNTLMLLVDFRNVAEGDKRICFLSGGQQSVYRCRCSRRYSGYSSAAP